VPTLLNVLPRGHRCLDTEEKAISPGAPPAEFNRHAVLHYRGPSRIALRWQICPLRVEIIQYKSDARGARRRHHVGPFVVF
jgi:hypothetical protein